MSCDVSCQDAGERRADLTAAEVCGDSSGCQVQEDEEGFCPAGGAAGQIQAVG